MCPSLSFQALRADVLGIKTDSQMLLFNYCGNPFQQSIKGFVFVSRVVLTPWPDHSSLMKTISTPELLKFRATDNGFRSLSLSSQGGFKFLSMVFFLSDNTLKQKQSLGLQEASCPDWKMTTQCGEITICSSGQGCGAVQAGLGMATFTTSPTNIRWKIFKFLFLQKKIKLWNIFRKHNCREGQLQNLLQKSQSHPQWDCPNWPLFFGRHRWGIKVHLA